MPLRGVSGARAAGRPPPKDRRKLIGERATALALCTPCRRHRFEPVCRQNGPKMLVVQARGPTKAGVLTTHWACSRMSFGLAASAVTAQAGKESVAAVQVFVQTVIETIQTVVGTVLPLEFGIKTVRSSI